MTSPAVCAGPNLRSATGLSPTVSASSSRKVRVGARPRAFARSKGANTSASISPAGPIAPALAPAISWATSAGGSSAISRAAASDATISAFGNSALPCV